MHRSAKGLRFGIQLFGIPDGDSAPTRYLAEYIRPKSDPAANAKESRGLSPGLQHLFDRTRIPFPIGRLVLELCPTITGEFVELRFAVVL